ncbi:MAG: class I SAM-dependent methyltransferase [Gemmatimonadaceae bacterium]
MPGPSSTSSYDAIPDFGMLYDSVPAYAARGDVQFYVREAADVGGPVLELGCGTGRILLPLARAGHPVVGLDSSQQMLARCGTKVLDEPDPLRTRITLYHGDVRGFNLGETFALVIAPFRILQHLATIDDQLSFMDAVARHVAPGGRFIFDVFNPNFAALASADGTEREDTPEQPLPDGRSFRRTARVARVRWVEQVSETELIYYVSASPGATAQRYVQSFDMRWYVRTELLHLLARGGFRLQSIYGDFDGAPLADGSPEQVVCAERLHPIDTAASS